MTALSKATLAEVTGTGWGTTVPDSELPVQFNPTSLRVQISNKTAGGQQAGSQGRQRPGTGETTVSFDLVFDSADEGDTDNPVPVTKKTELVEKYVRPKGSEQHQEAPPRVEFKWGTFIVHGVMESASIELDFFSASGTPLRAKMSVSIKGQDPRYEYPADTGAGGGASAPAGPLGGPAGSPGTAGSSQAPAKIAQALPGEGLPQLAARVGLDPSAWRALAGGISNPFSLSAGLEIGIPAGLSVGLGVGGGRTQSANDTVRGLPLASSLTSAPSASPTSSLVSPAKTNALANGTALAKQGGLAGSIDKARASAQRTAVDSNRSGFGLATAWGGRSSAGGGATSRGGTNGASASGASATSTSGRAQAADPTARSAETRSFAGSVPLWPRRGQLGEVVHTVNPTTPAWQALPAGTANAVTPLGKKRPKDPCACKSGARRGTRRS